MAGVSLPAEDQLQLAIEDYRQGKFTSIRKAAEAYDIYHQTMSNRINGIPTLNNAQQKNRKLSVSEELALVQWILSIDERGMSPTIDYTRQMASLLLAKRGGEPVGQNWVQRFVNHHKDFKACYSRRYDYKRALCKDPVVIQQWFQRVVKTIEKYGIVDDDIYNFDKTGFQIGVARTAKVLT